MTVELSTTLFEARMPPGADRRRLCAFGNPRATGLRFHARPFEGISEVGWSGWYIPG